MTRSPGADKVDEQLSRLPELVRVIRNIFLAEQRNVLPVEVLMQKLGNSYTARLSAGKSFI